MSAPLLVADSGPLIALARLDLLAIPSQAFGELLVTATVWREVTREPRPTDQAALATALAEGSIQLVEDPLQIPAALESALIDEGERSALALALERNATVLVDERRGRACAVELGLHVLGTLGLLVRAREQGLVGPLRPLTDALIAGGYFLAPALVERTLASIGE
jgi:predicted nucleic acid-binding protein